MKTYLKKRAAAAFAKRERHFPQQHQPRKLRLLR